MLEACNQSLGRGACVYALEKNSAVEHMAEVTWTTPNEVTVNVQERDTGRAQTRRLRFENGDEALEKWRVVGFTTALLAGEAAATEASKDAPKPVPASQDPAHFWVATTGRVLGASGLRERAPKIGAQLRIDARAWQAPWLLGVSGEYSRSTWTAPGIEGQASWLELGLGATRMWHPARELQLFTRVDVLAQRLTMSGRKKNQTEEAALWQPGLRLALDLEWPLARHWYALVGVHGTFVVAPVALRVDGKTAEQAAPAVVGLNAGLQYRF